MKEAPKVFYIHIRDYRKLSQTERSQFMRRHPGVSPPEMTVVSNGGATIGYVRDGNIVLFTIARCNKKDTFCRRIGRAITRGRLLLGKNVAKIEVPDDIFRKELTERLKDEYYESFQAWED